MKIDLFRAAIDDGNTIEDDSKEGTAAIPSQT